MAKEIKFNVRITVDGKEQLVTATSTVADLRQVMDKARGSAGRLRDTLLTYTQTVQAMQNVTNAISQLSNTLNNVTEESRTFGAAMKAANTMAGKDAAGFTKLKDQVAELSKTIPMARDQLANGLYQVISNGVPEDNWISYLQASAKSAVGGIADVGEVVKVTSTIIKNYGLEWSAAQDIQDKIQLTAKNGVTSFEQLAAALPSVTGQAAQLGVSFTEMLAVMSTLTGVTGNTSEVATQLSSVLTALTKESAKSQKMAEAMGISFNAASIKAAGGLRNYLQELDKTVTAYASKTGELRESIYSKLFGRAEALRLVNALTGQLAEKYDENIVALQNSEGTMNAAYENMASTGASQLQVLKNEWGKYTDWIADKVGGIQPLLNFGSQLGMTIVSVATLAQAFQKLHFAQSLMSKSLFRNIAAYALFGTNTKKAAAAVNVMSQSFRSAATRAVALKIAIRGLMVASGVGAALVALGVVLDKLVGSMQGAADVAGSTADGMEEFEKAADTVKEAYDSTLSTTYANLMEKYEQLKQGWKSLSTEQEKVAWIKNNQAAFYDLHLEISGVTEAENIFNGNTDAVVEAFTRRAKAAARMAQLTELYRKQIALSDKYTKTETEIKKDAAKGGRSAKAGDLIPEGWKNERYGKVDNDGRWHFSEQGAKLYSGTDVSTSVSLRGIQNQIAANDAEIKKVESQLAEENAAANVMIRPQSHNIKSATEKGSSARVTESKSDRPAAEGSIDWYNQQLEALRKRLYATADEATASALQADYGALENKFKDYKVRIGVEKPEEKEAQTYIETLRAQLSDAQKTFEDAVTIEARVEAATKIEDLQAQIEEATKGRVTIKADVEPIYIEPESDEDNRQSYSNAQQRVTRIQQDYEIGLIGKDEALQGLSEINQMLENLGLKPINIEINTDEIELAKAKFQVATDSIASMGQALSSMGGALELPELNVAGTIAQAIATMAAGYATATTQAATMGPWAWVAFAATGLAQLAAVISSIKNLTAFANGGIVSGPTMALVGEYAGASNNPEVIAPLNKLRSMIQPTGGIGGTVRFEIDGRKLVGVIANETRISSKSGRRTNIKG